MARIPVSALLSASAAGDLEQVLRVTEPEHVTTTTIERRGVSLNAKNKRGERMRCVCARVQVILTGQGLITISIPVPRPTGETALILGARNGRQNIIDHFVIVVRRDLVVPTTKLSTTTVRLYETSLRITSRYC